MVCVDVHRASFALILVTVSCTTPIPHGPRTTSRAGDHDVAYVERHSFWLKPDKDHQAAYQLTSQQKVSVTYLSERATEDAIYRVPEQSYIPLDHISAHMNGEALTSKRIILRPAEVKDVFVSNMRIREIRFGNIDVGSTVGYTCRWRFTSPAFLPPLRIPNIDFVKRYELVFHHPADVKVRFKLFFPRKPVHYSVSRSSTRTRIQLSGLRHDAPLKHFPFNHAKAYIWPQLSRGSSPINPVSARDFVDWYLRYFRRVTPHRPMAGLPSLHQVQSANKPIQKLRAIYSFVQQHIRYIADERGHHAFIPHDPSLVLRRRYGDCKDKVNLMVRLARQAGIKTHIVLVGTRPTPSFEGVYLGSFNHVIAMYEYEGKMVFLDPTCRYCEFGILPQRLALTPALVLDPDAPRKISLGATVGTPALAVDIEASVHDLRDSKARLIVRGGLSRFVTARLSANKLDQRMQAGLSRAVGQLFFNIKFRDFTIESHQFGRTVLNARADLEGFMLRSSRRIYVPKIAFRTFDRGLLDRANDPHAIYLRARQSLRLRLRLVTGSHALAEAAALVIGRPGTGEYWAQARAVDGNLIVKYLFHGPVRLLRRKDKAHFLAFARQYLQARRAMYVLERGGQ